MLPGDIDLTQNLDFRKSRKKEIPKFPDTWNGDNKISNKLNTYINTSTNNFTFSNIRISSTNSAIINANYNYTTEQAFNIRYYYDANAEFTIYDTVTTSTSTPYITFKHTEPEKDIFGNIIKYKQNEQSKCSCGELLMPWENVLCRNCNKKFKHKISSIPWNDKKSTSIGILRIDNNDDSIPWDNEDNFVYYNNKIPIQELICYLADKSKSFISRYLNRNNEDNTSYLTNMNWIGVRDAIID